MRAEPRFKDTVGWPGGNGRKQEKFTRFDQSAILFGDFHSNEHFFETIGQASGVELILQVAAASGAG